MLNPKAYENSRPDGFGVLEIVGEQEARLFVPLKRTELGGEVIGPLASLRLTQTYGYSRAQCDKVLEAVYRFPLPGDAAVTNVVVSFGEVEIIAELKERKQAEAEYETAKQEGRQAALATRESPDVFTLQVAGIQPDQDITVVTSYVQLARVEGDNWSLRIPLTTAPRYVRSDELTSRYAQGQPLALLRDPGHRFQLDLNVSGVETVTSRTHQLSLTPNEDGAQVQLQDGEVIPDRDCVLSWQPRKAADKASMQVWLHNDQNQLYFLALVAPPATHTQHRTPREVTLLVDHSGSMEGAKWQAADWAVESFLLGLKDHDAFALGLFHNTTRWFDTGMKRADAATVNQAVQFLKQHKDSGGTELGVALEQALSLTRLSGEPARHVLILTDAEVTDEGRILRLADEEAQRQDRRRVSVLCIDAAPNSHLALELAERGGGSAKFLTSNPAEEDITTALDEVLADWAEPVLPNLRLEVNRADAQAAGRDVRKSKEAGWSVIDLGDLPAGRAVWVVGRVPHAPQLQFNVRASNDWDVASCELSSKPASHPALKALFGARKVLGLEFLMHSHFGAEELRERLQRMGYDAEAVLTSLSNQPAKVYAENVRADASAALHDLLVSEALQYGLASSETAFVAVRKEAGQVIEGSVAVANALPSGWDDTFLARGGGGMPSMSMPMMAAVPPASSQVHYRRTGSSGGGSLKRLFQSTFDAMQNLSFHEDVEDFTSADESVSSAPSDHAIVLFSGVPQLTGGEAVLFDSSQNRTTLPEHGTITTLMVQFTDGAPANIDAGLSLLLFVDDFSTPRARMRLADLVRQGGVRPVNLQKLPGQVLRIVLTDPTGAWTSGAPRLEVALVCA